MKINTIGVIGGTNGLGERLVMHWRQQFPERDILVSGRNTEITNKYIVQNCDLVIFAIPIGVTLSVMDDCVDCARTDQIWADITSIKKTPTEKMLSSKAQVCGIHPLFGPLPVIAGQPVIYCPARIEDDALEALLELFSDFDLIEMTPQVHDDTMGVVQCVSHLSDFVMGETLRASGLDFETIWKVSSPSYRVKLQVMGRMFAQNPDLYIDIATLNESGPKFTAQFQTALERLKLLIDEGDRATLIENFDKVKNYFTPDFCERSYATSQQFMSLEQEFEAVDTLTLQGKIAVFGAKYSHTDNVVPDFFPDVDPMDITYFSQIEAVFTAVEEGRFSHGIVPFENSTHGSVLATLDSFFVAPGVNIISSQAKAIGQYLIGLSGTKMSEIKTVLSHPQALAQSRDWLMAHLPEAQRVSARSTALAAERLVSRQNKTQAVIGGEALASGLGLEILARNLEPIGNTTRFINISREAPKPTNRFTSLVFWFERDQAGNLSSVLQFLADNKINLTKLDSRRSSQAQGRYVFFIDAEIALQDFQVFDSEFKSLVDGYRILGSFDS